MGLIACTVMPLMLGQSILLLDPFDWASRPESLFATIGEGRGTLVWLPNFAFEHLTRTVRPEPRFDLSSVRAFINCSEPCKALTFDRFAARFAPFGLGHHSLQACYATAETVFAITQTALGERPRELTVDPTALTVERVARPSATGVRLLSSGRPIQGVRLRVEDGAGQALEEGRVGELAVACPFLFDGYCRRPEATAAKLEDGWYRTGDLGCVVDGEVYVLGRVDDLIIVHGRNHFAHEIEAVVNGVPGLRPGRSVAVGVFSEAVGSEEAVVLAEPAGEPPPAEIAALRRAVRGRVLDELALDLRDVRLVPPGWLVKTTSGKLSRSLNRRKFLEETRAAGLSAGPIEVPE
jgi:acyl-CoA synthetase (AMP-forming)/AMP-acid ligase II